MSPHTENWMVLDGIGSKFRISKDCVEDMRGPSRVCTWYSGGSLVKCWLPKQVTKSGNTARLLYAVRVNSTPSCAWSGSRWLKAQNSKSASRFRTHRRSISLIHRYGSPRNDSCPLFEQQLCIYCISKNRSRALLPSLSKNRGIDSTTNLLTLHNYITRKKKTKKNPSIFDQYLGPFRQCLVDSSLSIHQGLSLRCLYRYYRLKCGHEDPIVASKCIAQQIGQQNERRPWRDAVVTFWFGGKPLETTRKTRCSTWALWFF